MRYYLSLFMLFLILPDLSLAQNPADYRVEIEPASLQLAVGDTAHLSVNVYGPDGLIEDISYRIFSRDRSLVAIDRGSRALIAVAAGETTVAAGARIEINGERQMVLAEIPVEVPFPPLASLTLSLNQSPVFTRTEATILPVLMDVAGNHRDDIAVSFRSSNSDIASISPFGNLVAHKAGQIQLIGEAENLRTEINVDVVANPIRMIELNAPTQRARTGDVIPFSVVAMDNDGTIIDNPPVTYSFTAKPADNLGPASTGQIQPDGRFVADQPGLYTIIASTGTASDQWTLHIEQRQVTREMELIGHGLVGDVFTSDLWVWEGVDGRDYALTGTWSARGDAFFWDVTDPALPTIIDTITVDARTVNDVKVSEDGTICVISREGASNRRNGLVILDCTDPSEVTILSEFDENLTGGVHNVFIYQNHIYALSAGQRYDIINIEDPAQPRRVGSFELDAPGQAIHDVWVEDGIAYSSNWSNGVVMVDVGNGIAGGSPANPVQITSYAYPSGWNHAAFPYHDKQTGKRYIIAGDEHFIPSSAGNMYGGEEATGWIHFIDVTDVNNPMEVARYEVPEAGTHNLWVEGDTLYVAYYQGGLRVVDISGDLMGNLYDQGREIAVFKAAAPGGKIANSPMAWGPQPYKGNIFFSDHNSGLWVVRLKQDEKEKKPGI